MSDQHPSCSICADAERVQFLRLHAVSRMTGLARSTIFRMIAKNDASRRRCVLRPASSRGAEAIWNVEANSVKQSPTEGTRSTSTDWKDARATDQRE